MGLFRQYFRDALVRLGPGNLKCLGVLWCLFLLPAGAKGQTTPPGTDNPLPACLCSDVPRLQDRLQKLKGALLLVANQVQSTSAAKPATRQKWAALQSQINGYLRAMEIQGLTTFPEANLFDGNGDPFCGPQMISAGACLDQDYTVHQQQHEASCRAGHWSWQTPWTEPDMLDEEAAALAKEVQAIQETIKHLGCGVQPTGITGNAAPPAQPSRPAGPCPQFTVVVQNVTQTSVNIPGALTAQSGRSLNNGQGVWIPLSFQPDATFEGVGSGSDSGTAAGATPGEAVHSQFGHMQAIAASGFIRPGSCTTQPCQPDVMHLVLAGGPSQQVAQAQARGALNRDFSETTATSGAVVVFDLPAYLGGSAQRTFMSSPLLNSYMTVNLAQGNNGTPALPQGSSLLYSLQQCRAASRPQTAGGGGPAGIVVPGLEGNAPGGIPPRGSSVNGGAGITVPGLEGNIYPSSTSGSKMPAGKPVGNAGIVVPGLEGVPPASLALAAASINIQESVHVADQPLMPLAISVSEAVHVNDAVTLFPGLMVGVGEAVHISDTTNVLPK